MHDDFATYAHVRTWYYDHEREDDDAAHEFAVWYLKQRADDPEYIERMDYRTLHDRLYAPPPAATPEQVREQERAAAWHREHPCIY